MPTRTKKAPVADRVYVATESVSFGTQTINAGERRRGDDRLVLDHPQYWAPDGTPVSKVPPPELKAQPKRGPEVDAVAYEHIDLPDVVVSRRPLKVRRARDKSVIQLPVGTVIAHDAELVRLVPDAWVTPRDVVKR